MTRRGRHVVNRAGAVDIDRRAVDEERAALGDGDEFSPHGAHVLARRQHGDDDIGVGVPHGRDGGRAGRDAASFAAASDGCERSKPTTAYPALTRLAAIGPPMLPRPMNAMVVMVVLPECLFRVE